MVRRAAIRGFVSDETVDLCASLLPAMRGAFGHRSAERWIADRPKRLLEEFKTQKTRDGAHRAGCGAALLPICRVWIASCNHRKDST